MNRNKPYPNPGWDLASLVFGNHPIKAKCARAFMSRKACHAYIGIGEIPLHAGFRGAPVPGCLSEIPKSAFSRGF